jgi:hypothetical protein
MPPYAGQVSIVKIATSRPAGAQVTPSKLPMYQQ